MRISVFLFILFVFIGIVVFSQGEDPAPAADNKGTAEQTAKGSSVTTVEKKTEQKKAPESPSGKKAEIAAATGESKKEDSKSDVFTYPGLPSLELFPLSDPSNPGRPLPPLPDSMQLKLPPLKPIAPAPKTRIINGRLVIMTVPKKDEESEPAREVKWIAGKRVIGLKSGH